MTEIRPRRSALYMPGSNARALEKARSLPADVVILDLEDAVAPDAKETARAQVAAAVSAGGFGPREVVVRINGLDTPWGDEDLSAAIACVPDAILLPKVSTPDVLATVARRLATAGAPHKVRIWAMVETPLAILNITQIAAAAADQSTRLECFVMGTNDLAKETGARLVPGRAPMLPWLATSLLAARAHGLTILDGVFNNLSDTEGFAAECAAARDMGFDGKTLIHPNQIAAANAAFAPDAAEVERARAIIAAFDAPENAGKGAINLDGRMVERLHAEMARRTVRLAEAIAARQ
ncbi:HpcH/HpaI aldolase/citrate lyase family protein [Chelatococcus composti]|jgi:Citrate lyase beta subunit|uniref:Citrate lyase subunit beta/citryl-CoA lyase n=1 Tax=Chelatococcus composti TaxID=1743235 RepID=A0A841KGP4_9HYPH|nr:CoA ester lyase [Chelatococcus composti]MBB6169066.1 citrate lyase subunit beta/citryl-CoA lyase [Chelatococcus composti]MBS7736052.1 CoA ester lyase [Chelatococcus composti]PZN38772.1 MAG: CoA ester lyase [Pseudomonadota bacterium]GGG44947.1 citrate lyase subunit beta [Chelatococcus composti]